MITVDLLNIFLHWWLKPMIVLGLFLSIASTSFKFSATSNHWFLSTALFSTFIFWFAILWLPAFSFAIVPQYLAESLAMPVSLTFEKFSWISFLLMIYVLVAVWIFIYQGFGLIDMLRLTRQANAIQNRNLAALVATLSRDFEVKKVIELKVSGGIQSPLVWGYWHPTIILPNGWHKWKSNRLKRILAHEIAHVARHDWINKTFRKLVTALFWPVPCVWLIVRQIEWLAELACDDQVISALDCRVEYAEDLLAIAATRETSGWSMSFNRGSQNYRRIQHVLDAALQRSAPPQFVKNTCMLVSILLIAPFFMVEVAAKPPGIEERDEQLLYVIDGQQKTTQEQHKLGLFQRYHLPEAIMLPQVLPGQNKIEEVRIIRPQPLPELIPVDISATSLKSLSLASLAEPNLEIKGMIPSKMTMPVYPPKALRRRIEGQLIVQFDVLTNGEIKAPKIVVSQPKGIFDKAVLKALKKSRFVPMKVDGQAVILKNVTETFIFTLKDRATDNPVDVNRPSHTQIAEAE